MSQNTPLSQQEVEFYRRQIFQDIIIGVKALLDAFKRMDLHMSEEFRRNCQFLSDFKPSDLMHGSPFPQDYCEPLKTLWGENIIQEAYKRCREEGLSDK